MSFDSNATSDLQLRSSPGLGGNRDFLLLFSAQVISLLGSGVTTVALALFAYELTGGKDATVVVGNALMLRILAFLIFSQPAGVLADRISRKQMLIATDIGRFALLGFFPWVTEVWQVYALIFLINALTACFTPAYEATIPQVAGPQGYTQALALSRVAVDVEAIMGPMLAGALVALFGVRWVFWFDGLTYLVSAGLIMVATVPRLVVPPAAVRLSLLSDVFYGTRVLLGKPALRQALVASFCEATAGAAAIVATVAYAHGTLGQGALAVAALMATVGLGSSAAALALGRLTPRWDRGRMLLGGCLLLAVVLLACGLQPPWWMFALLWAANGVGQALIALPSSVLLAEHTADFERGRTYAAHFALTHVCWLVTYPAIGYASAAWGAPRTFALAGLVCLLTTFAAAFAGRSSVGSPVRDFRHTT